MSYSWNPFHPAYLCRIRPLEEISLLSPDMTISPVLSSTDRTYRTALPVTNPQDIEIRNSHIKHLVNNWPLRLYQPSARTNWDQLFDQVYGQEFIAKHISSTCGARRMLSTKRTRSSPSVVVSNEPGLSRYFRAHLADIHLINIRYIEAQRLVIGIQIHITKNPIIIHNTAKTNNSSTNIQSVIPPLMPDYFSICA